MSLLLRIRWMLLGTLVACDLGPAGVERPSVTEREGETPLLDAPACTSAHGPRWVLRDKDGTAVPALVEPSCGLGYATVRCRGATDFGPSIGYPCVRVIDHDGQYVNVGYELASGMIQPCQGGWWSENGTWSEAGGVRYADADCAGERYTEASFIGFGGKEFTEPQALRKIDGKLWQGVREGCIPNESAAWSYDKGVCVHDPEKPGALVCPLREVPSWVVDLLSTPPYTLAVEYE